MSVYKGKCFCGAVEIMVDGEPVGAGYCHCASCRSWSAGPVNAFTLSKSDAVKVTKGEENVGAVTGSGAGSVAATSSRSTRNGTWSTSTPRPSPSSPSRPAST